MSPGVYFVLSGEAEVLSEETIGHLSEEKIVEEGILVEDEDEDHVVINYVRKGDFFGEISVLFNIPCTATVRTKGLVEFLDNPSLSLTQGT